MRRRDFLSGLSGAAIAWSRVARAQQGEHPRRIGFLASTETPPIAEGNRILTFRRRLQELGYVEGRDYILEARSAEGRVDRMPELAKELVALRLDVIVAATTAAAIAARKATSVIPVVGVFLSDPIRFGLVASYARPEGNVTGNLITLDTLPGKHLELARDLIGTVRRAGMLVNVANPSNSVHWRNAESTAGRANMTLIAARLNKSEDLDTAIQHLARESVDVILVPPDVMFFSVKEKLAALALSARLPSIYGWREHVDAGGFASYGTNQLANYRRAADFVDRILKGAKPADLPVELQTRFELVINLKTAKALQIKIPESFLLRADEVIE